MTQRKPATRPRPAAARRRPDDRRRRLRIVAAAVAVVMLASLVIGVIGAAQGGNTPEPEGDPVELGD